MRVGGRRRATPTFFPSPESERGQNEPAGLEG